MRSAPFIRSDFKKENLKSKLGHFSLYCKHHLIPWFDIGLWGIQKNNAQTMFCSIVDDLVGISSLHHQLIRPFVSYLARKSTVGVLTSSY